MQWLKAYFDRITAGQGVPDYDAVGRRGNKSMPSAPASNRSSSAISGSKPPATKYALPCTPSVSHVLCSSYSTVEATVTSSHSTPQQHHFRSSSVHLSVYCNASAVVSDCLVSHILVLSHNDRQWPAQYRMQSHASSVQQHRIFGMCLHDCMSHRVAPARLYSDCVAVVCTRCQLGH